MRVRGLARQTRCPAGSFGVAAAGRELRELTLDQIKTQFKVVDWEAYNASQKEWQDYYAQKIGQ